jgi:hypothetical protein
VKKNSFLCFCNSNLLKMFKYFTYIYNNIDKNSVYPFSPRGHHDLVNSMSAGTIIIIIINLYFLRTHKYLLFIPQHTPANQFQRISVVLYLRYSRSRRTQRGRSELYIGRTHTRTHTHTHTHKYIYREIPSSAFYVYTYTDCAY